MLGSLILSGNEFQADGPTIKPVGRTFATGVAEEPGIVDYAI